MANQIRKDKKKITVVLTIDQIKRLDGRAAELGASRNELISQAVDSIIGDGGAGGEDAASAKLDAISAKLDAIASAQGELKAQQLAQSTVIAEAIKNQPIAVQQQELPAPEVTDADVQAYIRARRPDIALNIWGDPLDVKKKGVFGRLFGRG